MTSDYIETQIDNISKLENNWNDNGALAFSNALITRAKAFAYTLTGEAEIFPTANDSIQLEIENAYGYIEIELFENGEVKCYFEEGN